MHLRQQDAGWTSQAAHLRRNLATVGWKEFILTIRTAVCKPTPKHSTEESRLKCITGCGEKMESIAGFSTTVCRDSTRMVFSLATSALRIDITERMIAEESLATIGRKLIEAHEEERTWIARELHDDVNQRMALLAIELDRWNQQLPPSAVEFHDHIHHAIERLSNIATDIQALSHRLHSSKLEYLGLVAAAKSFCKELSEQQKVEIDFSHTAIPRSVPKEISLCLFRVLQETLQNAVKHSGVRHFKVELCGTEGEIQLTVSDLGVGFDPQDAMHRRGLGLISMRERIQLVSGEFSIKSHPGSGTTIHARAPLKGKEFVQARAG